MSQITKRFAEAIESAKGLTPEQQDLVAVELIERARALAGPPTPLSSRERAELEAELQAARRGELASDGEVAAVLGKHGL